MGAHHPEGLGQAKPRVRPDGLCSPVCLPEGFFLSRLGSLQPWPVGPVDRHFADQRIEQERVLPSLQDQKRSLGGTLRTGAQFCGVFDNGISSGVWKRVSEGEELRRRAVERQLRGQRLLATHRAYLSLEG